VHWLVAALVLTAWVTREAPLLDVHAAAGYAVLALAVFRIAWGFAGTRHARFAEFIASPRAVLGYLRALVSHQPSLTIGHNPAGGWWIVLLLAFELAVTLTGIAAIAGMHEMGPLAGHVGHAPADLAMTMHSLLAWWMLGAIGIHVLGAIATSILHRENLVASMLHGMKGGVAPGTASAAPHRALAAVLLAGSVAAAGGYLWHAGREPATAQSDIPAAWRAECESCHIPYSPCLLPARSWTALLAPGADHFGEDLALSATGREALTRIAMAPRAGESWACWKMRESTPASSTPLRITATAFWQKAHERLGSDRFKPPVSAGPHDCGACHGDSLASTFRPRGLKNLR
jgi:cytochrome b